MRRLTTVGLGELLWDVFPEGRQLGGAPANFAYMTSLLGDEGVVASRIGNDELGDDTKRRLEQIGLATSHVQVDSACRTGFAQVAIDAKGQPAFRIADPAAWDFFDWSNDWQALARKADAVCFGSLAQRSPRSRETIREFVRTSRPEATRILDVNLRQSFYSVEVLAESTKLADIIKVNNDELPVVVRTLGSSFQDEESAAQWLLDTFHAKLICVTRGARGSVLLNEYSRHEHPGKAVNVVDTVGSGDAFTAALVYHYQRQASLAVMNEAANRLGSWVAGQTGATPAGNEAVLETVRSPDV